MVEISGFTFIHNALNGGYPLFEAMSMVLPYVQEMVVVDMQSDDGTRELLDKVASSCPNGMIKIVSGEWWPGKAGRCLSFNHSLHRACAYNTIWHFEADEVFGPTLTQTVWERIQNGAQDLAIHRIQVEQNFQRVRWYPEPVHRIFPKGSVTKSGHTTTRHDDAEVVPTDFGLLWDVTNCFRDNWEARVRQQAELWGGEPNMLYVPYHIHVDHHMNWEYVKHWLEKPHWTWTTSPFNLPPILEHQLGKTRYEPDLRWFEFKVEL